ncbi:MAG: DivIVA domain-containing protein [Actinomycetota bacterium]|nr:DivIVA domain-containing protein [Actinomycetota bacterium]
MSVRDGRGSLGLTPDEIARQEFPIELRGYDRASVEEFLHLVAENYAALLAETRRLLDLSRAPAPIPAVHPDPAPPHVAPAATAAPDEARAIIDAAVELSARIVAAGHEDRLRSAAEARRIVEAGRAQARDHVERAQDYRALLARAEEDLRQSDEAFDDGGGGLWGAPARPVAPPRATTRPAEHGRADNPGHLHIAWPPAPEQSPRQAG